VDAAYAPFLQRYTFMDRVKPIGVIEKFPKLAAWRDTLLADAAVKASTVPNIEAVWQENLIIRKRWLAQFVSKDVIGAAAA
jgi:glutathione S-transferase